MYDLLPKNEKLVDFKAVGETTGIVYEGKFKFKCVLDMKARHTLALEKTRLMADYANPSGDLLGIAISLATVRARVIDGPSWWDDTDQMSDCLDQNIVLDLYAECLKAEDNWKGKLKKEAEEAKDALNAKSEDEEASSGNEVRES
jgi:hypothetical protein